MAFGWRGPRYTSCYHRHVISALPPTYSRALPWLYAAIIGIGVLIFAIRGYENERTVLHFRDFKEPYGGARCLIHNCDPYDSEQIHSAWKAAGGVDVEKVIAAPYTAVYPPTSLMALAPVAALDLPAAHAVWKALITLLFSAAVICVGVMSREAGASLLIAVLIGAFAATSTILIMLGQVSGVVIPLLAVGLTCLYYERFIAFGTFCLFLAAVLKPQEAGFLVLYLLLLNRVGRRAFFWVAALSIIFAAASVAWISTNSASANWLPELRANVYGASLPGQATTVARGSVGGLEQTQLQDLFSVFRDQPAFDNMAALLVSGVLLALLAVPLVRLPSTRAKHLVAFAALACFTLLPVYHRQYDSRLLILVFPAVAYMLAQPVDRWLGWIGLALLGVAVVTTSHQYLHFLVVHFGHALEFAGIGLTLLMFRPMPEIILLLFLYFLVVLYRWMGRQSAAGNGAGTFIPATTAQHANALLRVVQY